MKSSRQIEKIVGRARAGAGRVTDERILTDAGDALANSTANRPQALRPGPTIWRFIMESKVTRYSAAAVVALAIGPGSTRSPLEHRRTGVSSGQRSSRKSVRCARSFISQNTSFRR